MADSGQPITIKKYANRRLYNTGTSSYVTLDDLAEMVKQNDEFVVVDAKTGDDITRSVLTQIIVEQESRGGNLLPIGFMRQLIGFYGDSMQSLVPSYLDFSMQSLTQEQERFRDQMTRTISSTAMSAMEDQVKRNMEMYERAFKVFSPFAPTYSHQDQEDGGSDAARPNGGEGSASRKENNDKDEAGDADDINDLRAEVARMRDKLDKLTKP